MQNLPFFRRGSARPSVAHPTPIDAGRESRYRQEDQQLDRERYEAALGAWEERVASQRARWRQGRAQRVEVAQARLDRDYQALRALEPDLFNGPGSIEFDPMALQRVKAACTSTG